MSSLDPGDMQDSGELAREQAANDQYLASLRDGVRQAKAYYDMLIEEGMPPEAAASVTGHWIGASIMSAPTGRMIEELMGHLWGEEGE